MKLPIEKLQKDVRENIRHNLIDLRRSRGLTQSDVGELVGKSKNAVASWEQGLSIPTVATLFVLSKFYKVSLEYFCENVTIMGEMI